MTTSDQAAAGMNAVQASILRFAAPSIGDAGSAARGERLSLSPGPVHVPDTTVDGLSLPGFELRAAAVRGLSHRHWRAPRQDAYAFDADDSFWVVAVADGVGSLPYSHVAAHAAVVRAVTIVGERLRAGAPFDWPATFADAAAAIKPALMAVLGDDGPAPTELGATTLVVAVGIRDEESGWTVEVGSVGDSRCALLREGTWTPLADPGADDPTLPATTAVEALPAAGAGALRTATVSAAPGDLVAVFTDGIGVPFGSGNGQVGAQLAEWWASPPHSIAFAGQVGFARRGFHDDRACVAVWLGEEVGP